MYVTRDYKESNVFHSAHQSHARHGTALNADNSLTGHSILPQVLKRFFFKDSIEGILAPDYKKIDVMFRIDSKLKIYLGNEINWAKEYLKQRMGKITEHDINR